MNLFKLGESNRHYAATSLNKNSSRSHCILHIIINQRNLESCQQFTGKLVLVDLAGSEKTGEKSLRGESIHINKSLSHLSNCISHLAQNKKHIPYRNCNLTRVLKESLGGDSHTIIFICLSPASAEESKCSLQFAFRAKLLKNKVVVNEEHTAEKHKCVKMKEKIHVMKKLFQDVEYELHRWRKGELVPQEEWINAPDLINSLLNDTSSTIDADTSLQDTCDTADSINTLSFDTSYLVETSIQNYSECNTNESTELNYSLDVKTNEYSELKGIADNSITMPCKTNEENAVNFQNVLSELEQVRKELAERIQEVEQAEKVISELSAHVQAKNEEIERLHEYLESANYKHQCEIREMNEAETNIEVILKESLNSLHVTYEEYKINFQKVLSELELVKKELAERTQEVEQAEKVKSELSARLQAEMEEVKRLHEDLESVSYSHQCEIIKMIEAQSNVEMKLRESLDSLPVMEAELIEQSQNQLSAKELENISNLEPSHEVVEVIRNEFPSSYERCNFIQNITDDSEVATRIFVMLLLLVGSLPQVLHLLL